MIVQLTPVPGVKMRVETDAQGQPTKLVFETIFAIGKGITPVVMMESLGPAPAYQSFDRRVLVVSGKDGKISQRAMEAAPVNATETKANP